MTSGILEDEPPERKAGVGWPQFIVPCGDARHLAVATFWKCDVLASWNCKRIANANKADHIRHVNEQLGFESPKLITPYHLLESGVDP
ncbi:MAG: hypothetical protein KDK97_02025 [Verrucomicrobiales bacterium]|nr:hypothetical protein [Verrucomicrobiales bacterium]MCP5559638.1 hypothetical protein [Verrucomicrobiaceae bacterium]